MVYSKQLAAILQRTGEHFQPCQRGRKRILCTNEVEQVQDAAMKLRQAPRAEVLTASSVAAIARGVIARHIWGPVCCRTIRLPVTRHNNFSSGRAVAANTSRLGVVPFGCLCFL